MIMRYIQCSDTPRVVSLCSKCIMFSLLCFCHIVPWKLFHNSIWRNLKEHSNINELLRLSHVTARCSWFAPHRIYSDEQEREALGTPKTEELSPLMPKLLGKSSAQHRQEGQWERRGRETRGGSCSWYPPTAVSKAGRERKYSAFSITIRWLLLLYFYICHILYFYICHIYNSLGMIPFPSSD